MCCAKLYHFKPIINIVTILTVSTRFNMTKVSQELEDKFVKIKQLLIKIIEYG